MVRRIDIPMSGMVSPPRMPKPENPLNVPMSGMVSPPDRKPNTLPETIQPMSGLVSPPGKNKQTLIEFLDKLFHKKDNVDDKKDKTKIDGLY